MKGFGTDEKMLIKVLATRDPLQINVIRETYHQRFHRHLLTDVQSEVSGWFKEGLCAIIRGPLMQDVVLLRSAMDGPGTKEKVLNDVLLGRSNADMRAIKELYQKTYHSSLESAVKGDLSMKTERLFLMVLAANRNEESAPVVPQQIDQDVMELYKATEGRHGTDELLVCNILSQRSDAQIRAIAYTYQQKFTKDFDSIIKKVCLNSPPLFLICQTQNLQHTDLSVKGILRPHGTRPPATTPHRNRQSYARRHAPRRCYARLRYQRPSTRQQSCAYSLGQKPFAAGQRRISA